MQGLHSRSTSKTCERGRVGVAKSGGPHQSNIWFSQEVSHVQDPCVRTDRHACFLYHPSTFHPCELTSQVIHPIWAMFLEFLTEWVLGAAENDKSLIIETINQLFPVFNGPSLQGPGGGGSQGQALFREVLVGGFEVEWVWFHL